MIFSGYGDYYDIYYKDKDYSGEVDYVLGLVKRFGGDPKSVLDMGCGTGRHMEQFLSRGLKCDGFDLSETMVKQARERLGDGPKLGVSSLTNYRGGGEYDLVVSMFAVMSYLQSNEDLIAALRTARKHMQQDSLFIFDTWFGPAVLSTKPEERSHTYEDGDRSIERKVTPAPDAVAQRVHLDYTIIDSVKGEVVREVKEEHDIRYMFVQEMELAMAHVGLELLHTCPFLEADGSLTTDTWNVSFVARPRLGENPFADHGDQ